MVPRLLALDCACNVGAKLSVSCAGTQATVEIDLYKGLKLQTQTGTASTGTGDASSVGLTYQFQY